MTVQEEIAKFRNGDPYIGDIRSFVEPSSLAIAELAMELRQNPSETVRTEIVKAFVNIGIETDPHQSIGNRRILSALFYDAGLLRDQACNLALEKIAQLATPKVLREYGPTIAKMLEEAPEPALFLVVAKAKAIEAMPTLQDLSKDPKWSDNESFRTALAALGDESEEEFFTKPFKASVDPQEKIEFAAKVGRIGTASALKALAEDMRTPLVLQVPRAYELSVRVEIAKALRFNFPECAFLTQIESDADYDRIERFCEVQFGVTWTRQRPEFLAMRAN